MSTDRRRTQLEEELTFLLQNLKGVNYAALAQELHIPADQFYEFKSGKYTNVRSDFIRKLISRLRAMIKSGQL